VEADLPTSVVVTSPATALERLIRQSPWLVADKRSAAKVFELLTRCSSKPCADIRLGLDTFADPPLLARIVRDFTSAKPALV
jgi:hypothetical protein